MSNAGRPPKFNNVDELDKLIQEYFDKCVPELLCYDKNEKPVYKQNPPTITGLALHLGFESRQSIYDYEKKEDFSYSIKRAKLVCESYVENVLLSGTIHPSGPIFALKNYGWKDTHTVESNSTVKINELSEKERTEMIKLARKEMGIDG